MKRIGVFFEKPNFKDYPFDNEEYYASYHEFAQLLHMQGGILFILRSDKNYLGGMRFRKGWKWSGKKFVEVKEEIEVDVIYDKSNASLTPPFRFESKAKILNPNPIVEICNDKFKTHQLFAKYSPPLEIVLDKAQLREALEKIGGKKMVIKPLNSEGGEGVVIGSSEEILKAKKKFPLLTQGFIDTSYGIPSLGIKGIHDMRMVIIDGEIIQCFARIPQKGSLLANVSQGGSSKEIPLKRIPKRARELAKTVDNKFKSYRRVYSIDVGFEKDNPQLIELNSQPAIFSQKRGKQFVKFQEKLADALLAY